MEALVGDLRNSVGLRRVAGRPDPVVVVSGTHTWLVSDVVAREGIAVSVVGGGRADGADVFVDWHAGVEGADVARLGSRKGFIPVLSVPDAGVVDPAELAARVHRAAVGGGRSGGWPVLEVVGPRAQEVVDALGVEGVEAVVVRGGRAGHTVVEASEGPVDVVLVTDGSVSTDQYRSSGWDRGPELVLHTNFSGTYLAREREAELLRLVNVVAEQGRVRAEHGLPAPVVEVSGYLAATIEKLFDRRGVNVRTGQRTGITVVRVDWLVPSSVVVPEAFPVELFWRATPRSKGLLEHPGHPVSLDFAPGAVGLTPEQRAEVEDLVEDLRDSADKRRAAGRPFPVVVVSGAHAQVVQQVLQGAGVVSSVVGGGRVDGVDVFVDWHAGVGGVDVERLGSRRGVVPVLSLSDSAPSGLPGSHLAELAHRVLTESGWPELEVMGARAQEVVDALGEAGIEAVVVRGGRAGHTDLHATVEAPANTLAPAPRTGAPVTANLRRSTAWDTGPELVLHTERSSRPLPDRSVAALRRLAQEVSEQQRARVARGLAAPTVDVSGRRAVSASRVMLAEGVQVRVDRSEGPVVVRVDWLVPSSVVVPGAFPVELFWRATPRSKGLLEHPGHPVSLDFAPGAVGLTPEQGAEVEALVGDLRDSLGLRSGAGRPFPVVVVSGAHAQVVQQVLQGAGVVSSVVGGGRVDGVDVFVDWHAGVGGVDVERLSSRWGADPVL
ncbi:hypothetical protein, partial [Saccharothrix yanglingensis]|uniref:hypothetical protein n=1 Tax=Saccharothrix yanglingensis TaxID=659496 RepID=UPI0027D2BEA4